MRSNVCTTITLGKWQGHHDIQGDRYIQVNFTENIRQLHENFGKLTSDRKIQDNRYLQGRYIQQV